MNTSMLTLYIYIYIYIYIYNIVEVHAFFFIDNNLKRVYIVRYNSPFMLYATKHRLYCKHYFLYVSAVIDFIEANYQVKLKKKKKKR